MTPKRARHGLLAAWTAAALLAPQLAPAQTTSTVASFVVRRRDVATSDKLYLSAGDCGGTWTISWSLPTIMGTPASELRLWATPTECGDEPVVATDKVYDTGVSQAELVVARSGTVQVELKELPIFTQEGEVLPDGGVAGFACGATGKDEDVKLCASYEYLPYVTSSTALVARASSLTLVYDTEAPGVPELGTIDAYDGAITVAFKADSDTETVEAYVKSPDDADFVKRKTATTDASSLTIEGLTNGVTYQLRLVAVDAAGNPSATSNVVEARPVRTVGFYSAYREAGGTEAGGCAAVPALSLAAVALAPMLLAALRRRRTL